MGDVNTNHPAPQPGEALRQELVKHFHEKRDVLRQQRVQQMTAKGLLAGLTQEEIETESMTTAGVADKVKIPINSEYDIVTARKIGRELADKMGFSSAEQVAIATAISEIARNIVQYAGCGDMSIEVIRQGDRRGIVIIARDGGLGIPDINLAMQDGYSTAGGLGLGLPGSRRMMDEFDIISTVGKGTTVTMKKWVRKNE